MKIPQLPPLLIQKSSSGYYIYTYTNKWDPIRRRSYRLNTKKVGAILGHQREGIIRWDKKFVDQYPGLKLFACERKGKQYVFTPIDLFARSQLV